MNCKERVAVSQYHTTGIKYTYTETEMHFDGLWLHLLWVKLQLNKQTVKSSIYMGLCLYKRAPRKSNIVLEYS